MLSPMALTIGRSRARRGPARSGDGLAEDDAEHQPAPADRRHRRAVGTKESTTRAGTRRSGRRARRGAPPRWCAAPRTPRRRQAGAPEGAAVVAGLEHVGARPGHDRADGRPPPSPLATVMTSGTTPACWCAHQVPVRPIPVCTSSTMSRTRRSSQSARTAARARPAAAARHSPPGSARGGPRRCRRPPPRRSSRGQPRHGRTYAAVVRRARGSAAARSRPARPACARGSHRAAPRSRWRRRGDGRPHLRASLIAPSFASAPLLQRKTRPGNAVATSRSASSTWGAV